MPGDRYRLYHVEKAKGGIGLTMTAGSAVVAEDSPPAFGNLHAYKDEIVPFIRRMTDEVHEHGAACMIQNHPSNAHQSPSPVRTVRLELEHADRVTAAEQIEGELVVERDRVDLEVRVA